MITKDGWTLTGHIKWEPVTHDVKETCSACLGRGQDNLSYSDNTDCQSCGGNGFRYVIHPRGEQPEVPPHLVQWMRDAFKEWLELYGGKYE